MATYFNNRGKTATLRVSEANIIRRERYFSNKNSTLTVTCAATGLPLCLAGLYRYCLRASMAVPRKEAGPERTFIAFTCPDESTTASSVTAAVLAVSKYCSTVGEAIARTDLTSLGGTMSCPREGVAVETTAASLERRGTAR